MKAVHAQEWEVVEEFEGGGIYRNLETGAVYRKTTAEDGTVSKEVEVIR